VGLGDCDASEYFRSDHESQVLYCTTRAQS
jgi:hypothetical protein